MSASNWTSDYITANGIRLHYHRTGGDKPPVVMAHGITDNGLCWTRAARVLAQHYDVIMVDARGHGRSDAPDQGYAPEDHAADLAGLIEALDLGKPALVGHSMGAVTAAVLAASYPNRVRGVVLEDPPWREAGSVSLAARMAEWRASIVAQKSQSREAIAASGRERSPTWAVEEFDAWAEAKLQVSPNVFEFGRNGFDQWIELVPRIACPTLLVTGDPERGAIVTPQVAEQVTALNDRVTVVHLPGAGHSIRREQFDRYVEVVKAFLAEQIFA